MQNVKNAFSITLVEEKVVYFEMGMSKFTLANCYNICRKKYNHAHSSFVNFFLYTMYIIWSDVTFSLRYGKSDASNSLLKSYTTRASIIIKLVLNKLWKNFKFQYMNRVNELKVRTKKGECFVFTTRAYLRWKEEKSHRQFYGIKKLLYGRSEII